MKPGIFATLVAAAIAVVHPIAGQAQPAGTSEPKINAEGRPIRLQVYAGGIINLIQWVMVEKGFCTSYGLKCELVAVPSAPLGIQAAVAGSLDIVVSSADVVVQAAAGGAPIQFVGGLLPAPPFALSMRSDVAGQARSLAYPDSIRALKGMKIGVTARGSGPETQMKLLLADAKMNPDTDVIFVAVGAPAAQVAALSAKQIDGVMSFEPVPTVCESSSMCFNLVDVRKGQGSSTGKSIASVNYAASRAFIEKNPVTVDAFRQASAAAIEWAAKPENLNDVFAVVKKHFTLGDLPDAAAITDRLVRNQVTSYHWKLDRAGVKTTFDYFGSMKPAMAGVNAESLVYKKAY